MLQRNPWPAAVGRLAGVVTLGLVVGLLTRQPLLCMLLALFLYLAYHVFNLVRLERWLRRGRQLKPPESEGLWGAIFDNLYRLQRRHRDRRIRLAQLLRRFKESANAMPDATVVLRGPGEMVWWNSMATSYLGLRWPQDQGQRLANLLRFPKFSEFIARGDWNDAIKVPSPVNSRQVLEVRVVPYGDDQKLLLARDVSRLHRLETMRRDFVANITHELRTPLTVIRGMAETLADDAAEREDMRRPLELIEQQTRRMERLVDDLLLLSRLETGGRVREPVEVDVAAMLRGLIDEAGALSGGRHRIALTADEALRLRGDEDELRSAFSNLISNAVKYTPEDGRIDVRWFEAGAAACLSVADTGVGIPGHHIPRLTERFYRVDSGRSSAAGGTGLGLAIVKHVLSRHGGRLEIVSQVEEGSTFTCVFPSYLRDGRFRSARGAGRRA
jgi:two-component system phosphate regulon sensor histidine kinase PhoR